MARSNAEVVERLRALAGWLESHPDLPLAGNPALYFYAHSVDVADSRGALTKVADALGRDAKEKVERENVVITGEIEGALVRAESSLRALGVVPVLLTPDYEPILAADREIRS